MVRSVPACVSAVLGAVAATVWAGTWISVRPPASYVERQVVLAWLGSGEVVRLVEPGRHELTFACGHVPDRQARVVVQIDRVVDEKAEDPYRECSPEQVRQLAQENRTEKVWFCDTLREESPTGPQAGQDVMLADDRRVLLGDAFMTVGGVACLVPEDQGALVELSRSAQPGDRLRVQCEVLGMRAGEPCVLVSGLSFVRERTPQDEPPWRVSVRWADQEAVTLDQSGERRLALPCAHREGAREALWVRLRHFRAVQLHVGGHTVCAELADTPQARSYGLQGRTGLAPDHGMLFYFPRAEYPTFVMKTVSFPLAIAFIRADGRITDIAWRNPGDLRTTRPSEPVNFVLEMPQGWFRDHGVKLGDTVTIP